MSNLSKHFKESVESFVDINKLPPCIKNMKQRLPSSFDKTIIKENLRIQGEIIASKHYYKKISLFK